MRNLTFLILILSLAACSVKNSELNLPAIFSDNMVLQQQKQVNLWGWSDPDTKITIEGSWGAMSTATTAPDSSWQTIIETPKFGGPYTITVKAGNNEKVINNVMIGEVWLCSGQSNMEMPMKGWSSAQVANSEKEIAAANYPNIRMFTVTKRIALEQVDDCVGSWEITTPATAGDFSATGYYFGLKLYEELGIPVGLIHSSWGGTPAESWTNMDFLEKVPGFEDFGEKLEEGKASYKAFKAFLSGLKTISVGDLPKTNPYENLDLSDSTFATLDADISSWQEMKVPGLWEGSVLPGFDGVVWLEKDFEYDGNGSGLDLYLGPVDDMDVTYINGVKIGSHEMEGVYSLPRTYKIPDGLLKQGTNRVAVKVIDTGGGGGIFGVEAPAILKGKDRLVELGGNWKYSPAAVFMNGAIYVFGNGDQSYSSFKGSPMNFDQNSPTVLYNGMITPIVPYTIQGAIWYQGESNVGRGEQYQKLFPAMISCWRDVWNEGDFPFYFVQIAPYDYGPNSNESVSEIRYAQFKTLELDNTGMAVTMDIGDPTNIHPADKKDVGDRLALWALSKTYGKDDVVCSGPLFKAASFDKNKVVMTFDYADNGLELKGNESYFEVAGANGKFYQAKAKVEGNTIVAWSSKVTEAREVRYGWCDDCEPNLFNTEGLPASPFKAMTK